MIQLPSSEFTYAKYGYTDIPWDSVKSTASYLEWLLAQNIIGYCNSMECEIRPRKDEMAVMFEIDNWQSWAHIPMDIWEKYLRETEWKRKK